MQLQSKELYEMQKILNDKIVTQHHLSKEKTKKDRIVAMLVELGELANEIRFFKFWSVKGPSEKAVILEEYVDGIHFLLSMGIDENKTYDVLSSISLPTQDFTLLFLQLYEEIAKLAHSFSEEAYLHTFGLYLALGEQLEFSQQDILDAYREKNKENHNRQDHHY